MPNLFRVRKSFVTLFELLIVMSIILLIAGVVTISIQKALVDQHFRTEVEKIVDDLRLAQELMLIFGANVSVVFEEKQNQEGITYWLDVETTLPQPIDKFVNQQKDLQTIRGVFFADDNATYVTEGKIAMRFLSGGFVMSKGIVRLATSSDEQPPSNVLQTYIVLPGYPYPVRSIDSKKEADNVYEAVDDEDAEKILTQEMMAKLPEKFKEYISKFSQENPEETPEEKNKKEEGKKAIQNKPSAAEKPPRKI